MDFLKKKKEKFLNFGNENVADVAYYNVKA